MILTEDRAASKPVCQGYVSLLSQSFEYPIYRVLAAAIRTARASQTTYSESAINFSIVTGTRLRRPTHPHLHPRKGMDSKLSERNMSNHLELGPGFPPHYARQK